MSRRLGFDSTGTIADLNHRVGKAGEKGRASDVLASWHVGMVSLATMRPSPL